MITTDHTSDPMADHWEALTQAIRAERDAHRERAEHAEARATAADVASRGYRERAEKAEAKAARFAGLLGHQSRTLTDAIAAEVVAKQVSETVPERHDAPDVAELRRLAENATPGPWVHEWVDGDDWWAVYGQPTGDMVCPEVCTMWGSDEAAYIAAASPDVVLGLLDRLAHMREARDDARAEHLGAVQAAHHAAALDERRELLPWQGGRPRVRLLSDRIDHTSDPMGREYSDPGE